MATATPTLTPDPVPYSAVVEAERVARLDVAARYLPSYPLAFFLKLALAVDAGLVAAQLDATADLLVRDGWVQHEMRAESGGWCLAGALGEVTSASTGTAWWTLQFMVAVRSGDPRLGAIGWNDVPGRTAAEVLELAGDAAEFARGFGAVA